MDPNLDTFDGYLFVPPDRSQILGRASWKVRYVLVGRRASAPRDSGSHTASGNRSLSRTLVKSVSGEYFVSVYKHKDDCEPIQQWSTALITDCQVQNVSHRKQLVPQPTLIITLSDKERKRRSSRAAGLVSTNKDSGATTLWFRNAPEDNRYTLDDWARFIMSKKSYSNLESPVSPVFASPFATSRSRDMSDYLQRPESSGSRLQHKSSATTYSTGPRDRPKTFSSGSPSLRSKRSDLSSPSATKTSYSAAPKQLYTTVLPTDIGPSGELPGDSWPGRTSSAAHGRSPINSPAHMRDSMSSHSQYAHYGEVADVTAPPLPGETILDRAFKLGHVPFDIPNVPGQEKLSSIARFDALMRDHEQRRIQKEIDEKKKEHLAQQSTFNDDDSSDESQSSSQDTDTGDDSYGTRLGSSPKTSLIPPTAQRALDFIAGRHEEGGQNRPTHRPSASRNDVSLQSDSTQVSPTIPPLRPHTALAKDRPEAQRTLSTPQLASPPATHADVSNLPSKIAEEPRRAVADKGSSASGSKRLSLTEITKRFSSSSSLLLVQTNASNASSRRSSEVDTSSSVPRTSLSTRASCQAARNRDDSKCGWRGSVNVVSHDGGFL